jgi:hypothetical protein
VAGENTLIAGRRCKIAAAVEILGETPRTIRNHAAAGKIPGAAKPFGTWTFDIALLHAFVAEKEKERCQNGPRPRVDAIGGKAPFGAEYRPAGATSDGHFARTIQKLRQSAARRNAGA